MAEEIVIKIDVSSAGAQSKLRETKKETDKFSDSLVLLKNKTKELTLAERSLRGEEKLRVAQQKEVTAEQKRLNYETEMGGKIAATYEAVTTKGTAAQKKYKTQAGLNNAILLETGRLASDASYGFTAIANNLSQIVSLGGSFIDTTGSIGSAFSELKKSLFGVGGLLLGFQILIGLFQSKAAQDFVKGLFGIKGALRELLDLSKSYGDNLSTLTGNFRLYTDILDDSNRSEEEKIIALKKLNKEYPDYNKNVSDEAKNIEDVNKKREEYIKLLQESALSQAAQGKLEEIAGEFGISVLENKIDLINVEAKLQRDQDKYNEIVKRNKAGDVKATDESSRASLDLQIKAGKLRVQGLKDETDVLTSEYEKRRKVITDFVKLTDKDGSGGLDGTIKVFESGIFDLQKIEEKYRKNRLKNLQQTDEEILAETLLASMTELDIQEESFIRKEENRLKNYKDDINKRDISDKEKLQLINDAETKYNDVVASYGVERLKVEERISDFISSVRTKQVRKNASDAEKQYNRLLDLQDKFNLSSIERMKSDIGANEGYYQAKEDLLNKLVERQKRIAELAPEGSLVQAQALIEVASLEDRIRENQFKKEVQFLNNKKAINTEYVNFTKGISSLIATIAGENEEVQKAALVIEKGAAIAGVVVNTQQANATAIANESKMPVLLPNLLPPFIPYPNPVKPASMAATGAQLTRNNVQAGISIASILATTLSSFSNPKGSSSGGTTTAATVQAPAFNVVGPSTTDQLLGDVQQGLSDVKLSVNLNEINEGQETLNFIGTEANVFPD